LNYLDFGIQQAKGLGETFKDIRIDLIYCSDLKRAVDTVKITFEKKYPTLVDKKLRELDYGDFHGNLSEIMGHMEKARIKEAFPNGESYQQAMVRVGDFCKELKEKYRDKTVLVVGHSATQFGLDTLIRDKTIEECLCVPFK